jgi:hypothetical protein
MTITSINEVSKCGYIGILRIFSPCLIKVIGPGSNPQGVVYGLIVL